MKPLPRPVARPAARPAAPLRRGIPAIVLGLVLAGPVLALETPIGKPQKQAGMEIAAVYLQPVPMEPAGMMKAVADSDIHLEADIRAQGDNANGFAEGAWVPYLGIAYEITKAGSPQKIAGELMPMVANDGPHYGDNVKLSGPGKYTLKLSVAPPGAAAHAHFGRHTDKETGVGPWFKPFTVQYEFNYAGV